MTCFANFSILFTNDDEAKVGGRTWLFLQFPNSEP